MKIKETIRQQRIKDIKNLYKLATADSDNNKESLYNILKETFDEEKVIDAFYSFLEKTLSITLTEAKKIYKSYNREKIINLIDLLYNEDDVTLEKRIHNWFKQYDEDNILSLFYHLCLILDTETYRIITQTIKEKANVDYVEVVGGGSENCSGICEDYCDGEVHKEADIELPPYHPGCCCIAIFYEKEDIIQEL